MPYYDYKKAFSFRKFGIFLEVSYLSGLGEIL